MSKGAGLRAINPAFTHPTAIVETPDIGEGTRIWAFTHVMEGAAIGANCNVGEHCFIEAGAVIGNDATIKNGNMLWEGITIDDGVFVGPGVLFTNDRYPRSQRMPRARLRYADHHWLQRTTVKRGASLGAGAVILPGITVGEFAMVAAGAVVTKDVPSYALVVGNPAHVHGWVCQCGRPLTVNDGESSACNLCGLEFDWNGSSITPQKSAGATSRQAGPTGRDHRRGPVRARGSGAAQS